jgi:hypothetical protein
LARIDASNKPAPVVQREKQVTRKLLSDYELTGHDRARMRADFKAVADWAARQGIPAQRVFLGEFGCTSMANHVRLGPDRVQWLRAVRETAEEFGFGWALWAYKGYGGMALFDEKNSIDVDIAAALNLKDAGAGR